MIIFISGLDHSSNTVLYDERNLLTTEIVVSALINHKIHFREVYEVKETELRRMCIDDRIVVTEEFADNLKKWAESQ